RAIPSLKVHENELVYSFMDIGPLSKGHVLVIPKYHAQFLHEVPDEHLREILPIVKKISLAVGRSEGGDWAYNILQV
ncbi:hypothetical protein HK096_005146, partial [Nowakowskiella sp. JEL0078]